MFRGTVSVNDIVNMDPNMLLTMYFKINIMSADIIYIVCVIETGFQDCLDCVSQYEQGKMI